MERLYHLQTMDLPNSAMLMAQEMSKLKLISQEKQAQGIFENYYSAELKAAATKYHLFYHYDQMCWKIVFFK